MEKVRALLVSSGLILSLWGEALMHSVWLKNRTSTKALDGKTPYEAMHKTTPDLSNLPEWGCHVWIHDCSTGKLSTCAKPARWIGYDQHSNGHRIFWPEKRNVSVERSIRFSTAGLPVIMVDTVELEGEGDPPRVATIEEIDDTNDTGDNPMPPQVEIAVPNLLPPRPPVEPMIHTPRVRCATQYLHDIKEGVGSADNRPSKPNVPVGMHVPLSPEPENEASDETEPEIIEEIGAMAMAVEMSKALGLEPHTFAEAKRSPA
jgi:hypothetical protein